MAASTKVSVRDRDSALTFIGGIVLGAVCGFLSRALLLPQEQSGSTSKSRRPTRVPQLDTVPVPHEELKMVLCVNQSLGMGKGKIGAQCAHAALGASAEYRPDNEVLFRMWESTGQPKIALKVQNEEVMAELAHKAMQNGMPYYIVRDQGRTQIPAGSQTVLAIGPAYKSDVDRLTGHLLLL